MISRILPMIFFALATLNVLPVLGQQKPVTPDLAKVATGKGGKVFNRSVTAFTEGTKKGIRLDEKPGDGSVWLERVAFTNGIIELDMRGKDVLQRSFIGVAFHGVDSSAYDAIYFRPFNFRAQDPVRRSHAVQYVSHPQYTWQKLRSEQPDKYEQPIAAAPDPNEWFHVRIVVESPKVSVFVNGAREASLVVQQLSRRKGGSVALWVGNNSAGDFANLSVTRMD